MYTFATLATITLKAIDRCKPLKKEKKANARLHFSRFSMK